MASRRGPDNTARVAVSGTIENVPWANVFYVNLTTTSTPSQADLDGWNTAFGAAYKARFAAHLPNDTSFGQVRTVMFTPGNTELISLSAMTGAGTAGTNAANTSSAAVISWAANVYWRGGKPRTYLPGVPTGGITLAHLLTATYITNYTTDATNFRADVNALTSGAITGTALGFVSFRTANEERIPPVFYATNSAKVHPRLGTQRRRLGQYIT